MAREFGLESDYLQPHGQSQKAMVGLTPLGVFLLCVGLVLCVHGYGVQFWETGYTQRRLTSVSI